MRLVSYQTDAGPAAAIQIEDALVPVSPWIGFAPPEKTDLYAATENSVTAIRWAVPQSGAPLWWLLQTGTTNNWTTEVLPGSQTSRILYNSNPDVISIRAVDRLGNMGAQAILVPSKKSPLQNVTPKTMNWPPEK